MPLFVCDRCRTIDNTALGHYSCRLFADFPDEALCYSCMSDWMGTKDQGTRWHDRFPKEEATPERIREIGLEHFEHLGPLANEFTEEQED